MKSFFLTLLFLLFPLADAFSQVYSTQYRPPNQNWQELKSERFRVIYPEKYHDLAAQTLAILEMEYEDIQELVGGELTNFPVILNPENDRGNGFVSPFNFRSEIEIAPLKGKALNPRSGGWMESVAPHELVHALHFSNVSPNSFAGLLRILSPDMSRSLHGAAPIGFLEGLAVEHESNNPMHESGRGNYPYFYNQFNAMLNTDDEWSMGQLVHSSTFTTPVNRHYIGGHQFVNWLQETHGDDTMRNAIEFHHKYPIFGFGVALRHATGQFPGSLYNDFQEYHQTKQKNETAGSTDANSFEIPFNATCKQTSRPIWLDDETLLFHGRSCNQETGFYTYNFSSDKTELLYEVSITGDNNYQLSADENSLLYSRYHVDLLYDNIFRSDIHELNLESKQSTRLTNQKRVTSPRRFNDRLFAVQTIDQKQQLVEIENGEVVKSYPMDENSSVIEISIQPESGLMAILGHKNSVQALWFEDINEIDILFKNDPDIVFTNGSVFDPVWHDSDNRLLFTSDYSGVMNVYEYDGNSRQITQITESLYNAFEPSYSKDGQSIAYISQVKHEQIPFTLSNSDASNQEIDSSFWTVNDQVLSYMNRPLLNRDKKIDDSQWEQEKYNTGLGWLKPRLWLPTIDQNENDKFDEFGIRLESADRMSRHSYTFDVSHYAKDFWYDVTYRYKGFYPGFELSLFDSPSFTNIALRDQDDNQIVIPTISQQRGVSLTIPFQFRLEQNTRFSSLFFEPEYLLTQRSFRNPNDATQGYSDFKTLHTLGVNTTFNVGVRQFTRDIQPNKGLQIFTQTRYGLNKSGFTLSSPQGNFDTGFAQRMGFRGGATTYFAPLKRWNQSLRITVQGITQTDAPVFNNQSLYSDHFETSAFAEVNNIGIIDTRYTIPLTYPDDGGLLIPVYLSNIYLVGFTQTIGDIGGFDGNRFNQTARTIIGGGIRSRFKLSNLTFDVGVSVGWEPGTNNVSYVFGSF
ncbi:MAG: hypothetical protein WEA58_09090 [Balneolaceae bacterium]